MRRKLLTCGEAIKSGAALQNGADPSFKYKTKCLTKNELKTKFTKVKLQNSGLYSKEDDEILNINDVNYATPVYIRFNPMGDRQSQTAVTINNFRYKKNDDDVESLKFDNILFSEKVQIDADFFIGDEIFVNPKSNGIGVIPTFTYHPSEVFDSTTNGSENDTDYLFVSRYSDANVIDIYRQVPSRINYTTIIIKVYIDVNYDTYSAALNTLTTTVTMGSTSLDELNIGFTGDLAKWVYNENTIAFTDTVTDKAPNDSTVKITFSNPTIFLKKSQDISRVTASISKIIVGNTEKTNSVSCEFTTGGHDNEIVYVDVHLKYDGFSGGTDIGGGTITTGSTGNLDPILP